MPRPTHLLTGILARMAGGDGAARGEFWRAIYEELRAMARSQMRKEANGKSLQPTALVHEAYARLFGNDGVRFENRRHFFAAAANAMRQIRVDDARRVSREKRGGGRVRAELLDEMAVFDQDPVEVLAIDEALTRLAEEDPRKAEVVTMRYFVGLSIDESAEALNVSARTIDNDWRFARAWLHRELSKGDSGLRDLDE